MATTPPVNGNYTLCQAIARQEGFYVPGARAQRNNNPGNICYGSFAQKHGATGTDGRFAIFPSAEAGFAAMHSLLEATYQGLTLSQAIAKWAPPTENNTARYVEMVSEWTGIAPDTVLTPLLLV